MKLRHAFLAIFCASLAWSASGPKDRRPTDPMSIVSLSNPSARPVPIGDLYFTRAAYWPSWSPDGREIVFTTNMTGQFNLWMVSASGGWPVQLTQSDDVQFKAVWSPDGKWIVFQQDHGGNGVYDLYAVPSDGGEAVNLTNTDDVSETNPRWSPDGKSFTYVLDEDGRTNPYLFDRATRRAEKILMPEGYNLPFGNPGAFAPRGGRLLLTYQSSTTPPDLWIYDLASRKASQLTVSAIASLKSAQMPPSQIVHYKTFDGKVISAFLWVPNNLKRNGSNPAIVLPHGGPTDQVMDRWTPDVAALVSRGYICIAPNFRGSTGYGLDFQKSNYQDLGGGDLQDVVYAAEFVKATGYVDPKRIGIDGFSYGGFMTLMAIGKTPDRWAAGVELSGWANWFTWLQHSDPLNTQGTRALMGDPDKNSALYGAASPINYFKNARAPLLILQGENDPAVPKEESEQVVDILKKEGRTVEVRYYPNEGHGLEKREDRIDAIQRTVKWFDRYLKKQ